jgi:hypothetical protein
MEDMKLTVWALDATLPLIRPDSYGYRFSEDMWMVHTPSTGVKSALFMATEEQVKEQFTDIGELVEYESEKNPGTNWKYSIAGPIKDSEWWKHRSEDGMLGDLDLSEYGI